MTEQNYDYVTWPELLKWAKAHGAVNDSIVAISIGTRHMGKDDIRAVVTITGHAHDKDGKPYAVTDGEGRFRSASWTATNELLRSLP